MSIDVMIILFLALVAFLYAAVGHGGASGYIAVFTLCGIALPVYKPLVLLMNIMVAGSSFIQYRSKGFFRWSLLWPFLVASIPAAFLGSMVVVPQKMYKLILGLALVYPVLRLSGLLNMKQGREWPFSFWLALLTGSVIGFASGFLNIGGGIFLSPVLLLLGWAQMKEAAAVSAAFIVCNSAAGLGAVNWKEYAMPQWGWFWLMGAVAGGLLGGWLGSGYFSTKFIQRLLALVLALASYKLIFLA
jgi:uncharacterized membrane protein YfcA